MTASAFSFVARWQADVPALTDPALGATFAEFTINAGGQVLTRHVQHSTVRDSVFVPVAPVATWLANCWPRLMDERGPLASSAATRTAHALLERLPEDTWDAEEPALHAWQRTHGIRFCGGGLWLPDIMLLRTADEVAVSWRPWSPAPGVEFLGTGSCVLPLQEFVDAVRALLRQVSERVEPVDPQSSARAEFSFAYRAFCDPYGAGLDTVAARVGRTRNDLTAWLGAVSASPVKAKERILAAYGMVAETAHDPVFMDSPVAMAARSAAPNFSGSDHEKLMALGKQLAALKPGKLAEVRQKLRGAHAPAPLNAQLGYQRARALRRAMNNARGPVDIEKWLKDRGVQVVEIALEDLGTHGVALWAADRALVGANLKSPLASKPWGRRAMLAHEAYHLLFDTHDRRFFGECTGDLSPAPSEAAANAFAAELLLPSSALPRSVAAFWTDINGARNETERLCREFNVGFELALRQLQNQRQLPGPVVDALLNLVLAPRRRSRPA